MTVVVIAALVIAVTVFGVKYFKLKQTLPGHGSDEPYYENQAGRNSPHVQSSASPQYENYPHDGHIHNSSNTGMLHGHSSAMEYSTDNIPYENPDDLNSQIGSTPYENPADLNLHHAAESFPRENSGDLSLSSPTDNTPHENPEVVTNEYLTIIESDITTENSQVLTSQYENISGRGNQYEAIHMHDISATVNPYEEIRH